MFTRYDRLTIFLFLAIAAMYIGGCISADAEEIIHLPIVGKGTSATTTPSPTMTATAPSTEPPTATPTASVTPTPSATPTWPAIVLTTIASGLSSPVGLVDPDDGSGRLFVVEQAGRVRILRGGQVEPTPLLDISDRVRCCGEQGLLGIALPPGYTQKGYFYLNYTTESLGKLQTRISRFRLSADT
ncbi:MAG: PQQ-dependent sugar dehydrogenase, partial [Chloroflexi bacterium]|nr:PQQ-dependent sugar dehydrogenase [Chloroflexota bacterium]